MKYSFLLQNFGLKICIYKIFFVSLQKISERSEEGEKSDSKR